MTELKQLPVIHGSLAIDFAIDGGMAWLRHYHSTMENIFASTRDWRHDVAKKRAAKLQSHSQAGFVELNSPHDWETSFPSELRASVVVSAVSFLEAQLIQVCNEAAFRYQTPFKLSNFNKLQACREYIHLVGKLRSFSDQEWEPIGRISILRNELVHGGMQIDSAYLNPEKLKQLEKLPGLIRDELDFLVLERAICIFSLDRIQDILSVLRKQIIINWEITDTEVP